MNMLRVEITTAWIIASGPLHTTHERDLQLTIFHHHIAREKFKHLQENHGDFYVWS